MVPDKEFKCQGVVDFLCMNEPKSPHTYPYWHAKMIQIWKDWPVMNAYAGWYLAPRAYTLGEFSE